MYYVVDVYLIMYFIIDGSSARSVLVCDKTVTVSVPNTYPTIQNRQSTFSLFLASFRLATFQFPDYTVR